jgi:threonine/homoserine/homoserine lactone efflux protein
MLTFGVMAATVAAITLIYSVVMVTLTTLLAERLRSSPVVVKWLQKTAGVFLIGFGLKLAAN